MSTAFTEGCGLAGAASLVEALDKRVLVQLRDGRKLIGFLRSYDQFANLVMSQVFERHIAGEHYADEPLGLFVVRGENIVFLGEIEESRLHPEKLKLTSVEAVKSEERSEKKTTTRDMAGNIRSMMDFLEEF